MKENVFMGTKFSLLAKEAEDRINDFVRLVTAKIEAKINKTPKFCKIFVLYIAYISVCLMKIVHGCFLLMRNILNFAVKVSIIAIALMMLYNFAQANPELINQIYEWVMNSCSNAYEFVVQKYDYIVDLISMPFKLLAGLFH